MNNPLISTIYKGDSKPNNYSPLNLAYLGDAVFALLVRTRLVTTANRSTHAHTKAANKANSAVHQSTNYYKILDILTEEEAAIIKRGRNANPTQKAKNATFAAYRNATGLEALFGYLYLQNNTDRIIELFDICWSDTFEEQL